MSSVYRSANNEYMQTCLVQWMSSEIKLRSVTTPGYSYTLHWCLLHKQISEHEIEQGKIMEET